MNMRISFTWLYVSILALGDASLGLSVAGAEELRFDSAATWNRWQLPAGLVQFDETGALSLTNFEPRINAVSDARAYRHQTKERGLFRGGIWQAGSNQAAAARVLDGDLRSFWQPDPSDGARNWSIEIDLGRVVLAQEVILHFPDRAGARPFRQFDVFVGSGHRFSGRSDDVFIHQEIYSTTLPNGETEIHIPLAYDLADTIRVLDRGLDVEEVQQFLPVQYVRFEAQALSADAALAEIEVRGIGGNIGPGAIARGGALRSGALASSLENAIDSDMDTRVSLRSGSIEKGWRANGMWLQVDLGATFWVERIFLSPLRAGFGLSTAQRLLVAGENAGLQPLLHEGETGPSYRHFFYVFEPRKIRYLILHALDGRSWRGSLDEFMVHAVGHPAQVILRSDFIDLGQVAGDGRSKAISRLSWDANLAPGAQIQLRSRAGNSLRQELTFHNRLGQVVTERTWLSTPKVLRGPIDSAIVASGDWDDWSNVYQRTEEPFKSKTPARLVQLEAILSTEDPQVTPVLQVLSVHFTDALVQRAWGRILPRQTESNQAVRFSYVLWPQSDDQDRGFDRLRLLMPGAIGLSELVLEVGGKRVEPLAIDAQADSLLFITLPTAIKNDSLRIEFSARILKNATVFALFLGNEQSPDIWQSVTPLDRHADVVFLPDLVGREQLVGDLKILPHIFSPNADGINDYINISFIVLNADAVEPKVRIFDLAGHLVVELELSGEGSVLQYKWDGRNRRGERVGPGLYLCDVDIGAAAGDGRTMRSIAVVY
ncbi:MAG: hypothetical protein ACI906_002755 [Candidatus Latescibacterota bacterium]|jgi:hypothetical protein